MRAALPGSVRALDGTAEAIPLEEASVDLVTVAQAFHWFDGPAALAEIHRVLRPGGRLALLWNRRVEDEPVNRAIEALIEPHRMGTPTHRGDAWRAAFEGTSLFGPLESTSSRTSRCWTRTGWRRASARSASSRACPSRSGPACSRAPAS